MQLLLFVVEIYNVFVLNRAGASSSKLVWRMKYAHYIKVFFVCMLGCICMCTWNSIAILFRVFSSAAVESQVNLYAVVRYCDGMYMAICKCGTCFIEYLPFVYKSRLALLYWPHQCLQPC